MFETYKCLKFDGAYGSREEHIRSSRQDILSFLKLENGVGVASTCISNDWFGYERHLLLLDCDRGVNTACDMLKRWSIDFLKVESSPENYWLITDYADYFDVVLQKYKKIPGIDNRHITFSEQHREIHVRIWPKSGFLPIFDFGNSSLDVSHISDNSVKLWIETFIEWWKQPEIVWLAMRSKYPNESEEVIDKMVKVERHNPYRRLLRLGGE